MSSTIELEPISSGQYVATSSAFESVAEDSSPSAQDRPTPATENVFARAVKRVQKWFLACRSKLQRPGSAIRRGWELIRTRAFESLCACLLGYWTKLQKCLTSLGQRYTILTWLGVVVTLVIGGVSLRYAYVSIRLAEWTARKDYQEICRGLSVCPWSNTNETRTMLSSSYRSLHFQLASSVRQPCRTHFLRHLSLISGIRDAFSGHQKCYKKSDNRAVLQRNWKCRVGAYHQDLSTFYFTHSWPSSAAWFTGTNVECVEEGSPTIRGSERTSGP